MRDGLSGCRLPEENMTPDEALDALRSIDTPTVTNAVATYPESPFCLGLYDPWKDNWYADSSIRCMYPELGVRVGYAVTAVYGLPDADVAHPSFLDVVEALDASPKPTILVIEQQFPEELMDKVGLAGEMMVTSMRAVGCVGLLTDGPSRDIDAVRALDFQMLLGGVAAGHGDMAVHRINVPVSVGGLDVAPEEVVHMDENGACKFPADELAAVVANASGLLADEESKLKGLRTACTAAAVRAALEGQTYAADEE